jgi:hypothetical protein
MRVPPTVSIIPKGYTVSIPKQTKTRAICQKVFVRAYGDEPVALTAIARRRDVIEVVGSDRSRPIGFPVESVFRYDSHLFKRLRAAYDRARPRELGRLWKIAQRY